MVANHATGKRRFDCYRTEAEALEAADRLARQLSERDVLAASITREEAIHYAAASQALKPLGVTLSQAVFTFAEAFGITGSASGVLAAAKFFAARNKRTVPKPVADVVAELLTIKESRGASPRYLQDLRYRLGVFADAFQKDTCNVTTAEVQAWLDSLKLASQSYANHRRVVSLLFGFAVARGYAADNPVEGVERVKVRNGDIAIFSPAEIAKLLAAASPDYLPSLALGAFAGLRSAEIERLEWSEIHLAEKFIVVGASKAKTAGRRIVPVADNLLQWLAPFAGRKGNVWPGTHEDFYAAQQDAAKAAGVPWKTNALRHSYASYRFALTNDAGRVAGECGNSAAVIHRHYRELVRPEDAHRWFAVKPEAPANVVTLATAANA